MKLERDRQREREREREYTPVGERATVGESGDADFAATAASNTRTTIATQILTALNLK